MCVIPKPWLGIANGLELCSSAALGTTDLKRDTFPIIHLRLRNESAGMSRLTGSLLVLLPDELRYTKVVFTLHLRPSTLDIVAKAGGIATHSLPALSTALHSPRVQRMTESQTSRDQTSMTLGNTPIGQVRTFWPQSPIRVTDHIARKGHTTNSI
jgi:hypothetical protein